ncbi:carotenoid ester lipase precursor [Lactifluus volemus]|nr:carotenoid ester lipase precursor [Lactifluus volemus]
MATLKSLFLTLCALMPMVIANLEVRVSSPIVTLDSGSFIGTTSNGINNFLGIPFAQPPVGDLRFRLPQELGPYTGMHNASTFGYPCPQQALPPFNLSALPKETAAFIQSLNNFSGTTAGTTDSEDCLTLNVLSPAIAEPGANLPVVAWIYGGGFEDGSTGIYNATEIVLRSIKLGEPIIYVSMNYRVSAFGFLASQEVKDAGVGNLGLHDQRMALGWIQKYICAFGGDPTKVTIWGESAGAISVALHMVANDGNSDGLFRAAFMQSGSPPSTGDITLGQPFYDDLVNSTGCSGSSDTLSCLRTVPYLTLKAAVDSTPSLFDYQSLALTWQPRVDGIFLTHSPQKLVLDGKVADIPFITGDCDDEGTLFSLSSLNITTSAELHGYIATRILPLASSEEVDKLLELYPQNITQGSPFGTGEQNAITPQFKRIAAILGDIIFQSTRRFFLQQRSGKQKTYSYLSKRFKNLPVIGSLHGSDLLYTYGPGELMDYLIHFVTNMDPNGGSSPLWPQYTTAYPDLMTFLPSNGTSITQDTYRANGLDYITSINLPHAI